MCHDFGKEKKLDKSDHESDKKGRNWQMTHFLCGMARNPPVYDRREDGGLRLSQLWCQYTGLPPYPGIRVQCIGTSMGLRKVKT